MLTWAMFNRFCLKAGAKPQLCWKILCIFSYQARQKIEQTWQSISWVFCNQAPPLPIWWARNHFGFYNYFYAAAKVFPFFFQHCCTMVIQKFKCGWTVFAHICHFCHLNVCQWSWDKRASLGGDWAWDTIDVLQDNASAIFYSEITFLTDIKDSDHCSGVVKKATWSDFEF